MTLTTMKMPKLGQRIGQAVYSAGIVTGALLITPAAFSAPSPQPLISQAEQTLNVDGESSLVEVQESERGQQRTSQNLLPPLIVLGLMGLLIWAISASDDTKQPRDGKKRSSSAGFWGYGGYGGGGGGGGCGGGSGSGGGGCGGGGGGGGGGCGGGGG